MKFDKLNINKNLKKGLENINYIEMTEIQEKVIPEILDGKNIIGQSKTGTGKTAAFSIPIINNIDLSENKLQALILCPTRELTIQVYEEIIKYTKYMPELKVLCIYGGQSIEKQIIPLRRGVHICIATTGRVIDHIRRKTIKLDNVKTIVLDEADEMLKMGFEEDVDKILNNVPKNIQTLLFSATITDNVKCIIDKYISDAEIIKIKSDNLTTNNTKQYAVETKTKMKQEAIMRFIDLYEPNKAVVFCNTKKEVDEVTNSLNKEGYICSSIHSDIRQEQRNIIVKNFKEGKLKLLIATDVAARGLDISDLDLVFNYDIPQELETYVHRIGRTGRNGKTGTSITLVVGKEKNKLDSIEDFTKSKIEYISMPTINEINKLKDEKIVFEIKEIIDNRDYGNLSLYEKICTENNHNYKEISKALYSLLFKQKQAEINIQENEEKIITLFFSCGKNDLIKAKDIVGAIANNTALSGKDIGKINVMDKFTFVEVPAKYVEEVIYKLNGSRIKNKKIEVLLSDKNN